MANRESMKQSVEPESRSVEIFFRFSVFIDRYSADVEKKEAALSLTSSRGAWSRKADTLLLAGVSTAERSSLGYPKTQLRRGLTHCQIVRRLQ
jgi:hypothetical protein